VNKKVLGLLSALAVGVLVAACGGGGSGSVASATASISGVASKGIMKNAQVQAYQVVNGTEVALGNPVTTGMDGSYTLTGLPVTSNPVVVYVTVTTSTIMLDETKPPESGGSYPAIAAVPNNLQMRAVMGSLSTDSVAMITPFTEMEYTAAKSTGSITSQSIQTGQYYVQQLIGMNADTVKPVNANVTNITADQKKLMMLLAGVQNYANNTATSCTTDRSGISCVLKEMRDASTLSVSTSSTLLTTPATASGLITNLNDNIKKLS
jgi:hypothetical protein